MDTINDIQDEIIEEFSGFDDWMDKYQLLIDLGNEQEPLPEQYKTEQNLIDGCQSRVWLQADLVDGQTGRRVDEQTDRRIDGETDGRGDGQTGRRIDEQTDRRMDGETKVIVFRAESDALIVKGIVALLIRVLSGHTPQEILDAELYFIDRIGLHEHLSPTRSNGLLAMVKQMRTYALAFKAKG